MTPEQDRLLWRGEVLYCLVILLAFATALAPGNGLFR
jgi:hypothetical protein